ncbi:Fic family protein [Larkinella knui]|uniref:Fic family protein n=1 Tax=Larkinella knui TaxID=2025310 RepID=A0A3P1CQM4_9BACT|nr:Fic family protein [Larkinella knui]RRB15376.1 Fic family protein [Larkinella knui]
MAYNPTEPFNELPNLSTKVDLNDARIIQVLIQAARNLGELNGLCATLPDPMLLLNTLVLQESRDSSAIENIVTTQDELFRASIDELSENSAAKEVLNYREAMYTGLARMQSQRNLIVTNTMIEVVQTIKQNRSAIRNAPGTALRNAQNGEILYTPPCCEDIIREKLSALEQFINENDPSGPDPLIKLVMMHYQFEAIYPFFDGNGRTGRILIGLYLVQQRLLPHPVLYLSRYMNYYRSDYYRLLRTVTEHQNWTEWIVFMLKGIAETAQLTTSKIRRILDLMTVLEREARQALGASYNPDLLRLMFMLPYLKIELIEKRGLAHRQTSSAYLKKLAGAGILIPNKIGRTTYYINQKLLDLLAD